MRKQKDEESPKEYYYRIYEARKKEDADYMGIPCDPTIAHADFIAEQSKFTSPTDHIRANKEVMYFLFPKRLTNEQRQHRIKLMEAGEKLMKGRDYYLRKRPGRVGEFKSVGELLGPVVEVEELPF